ncbi:hypothetical protein RRG08_055592 [Elysia crispata]|uniref:Uncharacterized protein n=1 Tax=Elysia crispata TaxID=231223 RepID=A0AAE1B082_9GAST|nr:hypothetical protein RRG08_055592 [Elysia crispata]
MPPGSTSGASGRECSFLFPTSHETSGQQKKTAFKTALAKSVFHGNSESLPAERRVSLISNISRFQPARREASPSYLTSHGFSLPAERRVSLISDISRFQSARREASPSYLTSHGFSMSAERRLPHICPIKQNVQKDTEGKRIRPQ